MRTAYHQRETVLAAAMDDRRQWEQATTDRRRQAVAADAELRRRHPTQQYDPLRSAEPAPPSQAETEELNLSPDRPIPEPAQWIKDLTTARDTFTKLLEEKRREPVTEQSQQSIGLGHLFPAQAHHSAGAILQPPRPQIRPSARVLERMREREAGIEAGTDLLQQFIKIRRPLPRENLRTSVTAPIRPVNLGPASLTHACHVTPELIGQRLDDHHPPPVLVIRPCMLGGLPLSWPGIRDLHSRPAPASPHPDDELAAIPSRRMPNAVRDQLARD